MDVSQVKNDIDSPLKWGMTYKSDNNDDFARHLAEDDRDVDAYEPKEKVRAKERVDEDDRIDDDDPIENADDQDQNVAISAATLAPAPQTPNATVKNTDGDTATAPQTASVAAAVTPNAQTAQKTDPIMQANVVEGSNDKVTTPATTSAPATTAQSAEAANLAAEAATTKGNTVPLGAQTQQAATTVAASTAAPLAANATQNATQQKKSTSDAPIDIKSAASAVDAKPVGNEQSETAKTQPPANALEKMRADEMAKMSEKDVLSSKISELLAKGKGKITTSAAGSAATGATAQGSLVSANNSMMATTSAQSTTTPAKTDTAIGMVTQSAQAAEMPIIIPNGDLSASLLVPQTPADTNLSTTTVVPGGAINGIDSTSTNSVSQANMAARASTQAGSPAEQVAAQISTAAKDGVDLIKVQLNPAELGRIDIKLEMGQDGRILAVISADNQNSLDLLQQDSKHLEKALQDAGFDTGSDSLNFSLNQEGTEQGGDQGLTTANAGSTLQNDEDLYVDPASIRSSGSPNSGLDIQV